MALKRRQFVVKNVLKSRDAGFVPFLKQLVVETPAVLEYFTAIGEAKKLRAIKNAFNEFFHSEKFRLHCSYVKARQGKQLTRCQSFPALSPPSYPPLSLSLSLSPPPTFPLAPQNTSGIDA